ncbi:MAG: glycoside hydrolase [Deferribacterales bacterium]
MKKLRLCFLWHMHQPYYKDDMDGLYHMPWVYLHALKDYFELPYYHREFPGIKGTYNLVPSLLVQLKDYESTGVQDTFIKLMLKDPAILTQEEKNILIPQLFMANYKNQAKPLKRYRELYDRKGDTPLFETAKIPFTYEDILDLEVLYLLSWCGVFTRQTVPFVSELIEKRRGFSQNDKLHLMDKLAEFVASIVPLYKDLTKNGNIEISATPFYHPILPLLLDHRSAKEALPDISMPAVNTDFSAHAQRHVTDAVDYFSDTFGYRPVGMWPAEGSISERAAGVFRKNGISWIASDEDVLSASAEVDLRDKRNRGYLYKKHIFGTSEGDINIFFRDKELSDLVGFTYSGWEAEKAVDDFMDKLSEIFDMCDFSPVVPVILDGENAWEYYPDNGHRFFEHLYKRLSSCNWIETMTMSEAVGCDSPAERLNKIRAGSWIYANFTTWMGHPEKNEAWRVLSDAHARYMAKAETLTNREKVEKELMAAEGSDWFWWYGDDHFSLQSDVFDKLFRRHIANIYTLMGEKVPAEVNQPIKKSHKTGLLKAPAGYISPVTDGRVTSFFEWLGAGRFDLKYDAGAMTASSNLLNMLWFGFDAENLYLRIDGGVKDMVKGGYSIEAEITTDESKKFLFPAAAEFSDGDGRISCLDTVFEAVIPRALIGLESEKAYLTFRLKKGNRILETAPVYNTVEIDFADSEKDWIA